MKFNVYSIIDHLAGQFGTPTLFANNALAQRWFKGLVNTPAGKEVANDLSLCLIGTFDCESGKLEPLNIEILAKGGDMLE